MIYIFIREKQNDDGIVTETWYPLDLKDDANAIANAKCNPGTNRVENLDGKVIWRAGS